MRGLVILCFSALSVATPQGYSYPQHLQGASSQQLGFGQAIQPTLAAPLQQPLPLQNQYLAPHPLPGQSDASLLQQAFGPQGLLPSQLQPSSSPSGLGSFSVGRAIGQEPTKQELQISKRFFVHSAPEEDEDEFKEKTLTVGTPRKNYNVVFIRAPAKSGKKASIKITPARNEDKTVIYVLSKKTDATDIDAQIQELPTTTTKPEVYFIKYKTPEEAAHAQEKIQAEYDSLGGSSQVSNEGIAPVSSVIGALEDKAKLQKQQQQLAEQQAGSLSLPSSSGVSGNQSPEVLPSASGPTISSAILTNNGYLPPNYYY